ncbi:MAG: hypothetical protein H7281_11645 [Bacteriovorax sp.]|nr:hypothetical protein [Bacteriovorax sp.]
MKTLIKIIIIFLVISAASTILYNNTDIVFGKIDFFSKHGWIFLFSIALFPRLTLLISGLLIGSIEFGGLLWWLGFFFAPRILVATLATVAYWNSNQLLVVFAWLIALGGESSEKFVITRRMRSAPHKFNSYEGTTIDAEYKVKE